MNDNQLKQAARDSVNFMIPMDPSEKTYGLPLRLERWGNDPFGEWQDTMASFKPDVLSLYPDMTPHPEAEAYGVGYGELVACKWNGTRYEQFAVWYGDHWKNT